MDVLPWMRWLGAWTAPFLAGYALAELLALTGATPSPPPAPVPPDVLPVDGAALGALGGVAVAMALALLLARWLAARPDRRFATPEGPGAAVAAALVLAVSSLLLWVANPYAGLMVVPAAHLWLLALLLAGPPPRRLRALLLVLGALPPLLVALYYLFALSIDPLAGAWYLLLLVTGHAVGPVTTFIGCVMLGTLCAAAELVYRSPAPPAEESRSPRGPVRVWARRLCGTRLAGRHRVGFTKVTSWIVSSGTDADLVERVRRGEYVIDVDAVAAALLRRWRRGSLVLIAAQPLDGLPSGVDEDEAPPAGDVA